MLEIELLSPSRKVFGSQATMLTIPGKDGYLGLMPGHAALVTELGIGIAELAGSKTIRFFLSGGYAEVSDDRVVVMANVVDVPSEIDLDRAKASRDRALERLKSTDSGVDVTRAEASLKRALYRLKISQN